MSAAVKRYDMQHSSCGCCHDDCDGCEYGMEAGGADYVSSADFDALSARNVRLEAALRGMVAIHDSVTQGQERELRDEWLPKARAALKDTP